MAEKWNVIACNFADAEIWKCELKNELISLSLFTYGYLNEKKLISFPQNSE